MDYIEHKRIVEKEKTKSFWYGAILVTIINVALNIYRFTTGG